MLADQPCGDRRVAELGAGPEPIPERRLTDGNLSRAMIRAVSVLRIEFGRPQVIDRIAARGQVFV
jgi:hypothetical protein